MGMTRVRLSVLLAAIAQLGERQTEDLRVRVFVVLGHNFGSMIDVLDHGHD